MAERYLAGLEEHLANGGALDHVASLASFFLSCIDTLVDNFLDRENRLQARELWGQTAIASARLAYQEYKKLVSGARWQSLAAHGARMQRLLWASTSTKDPAYDDVMYVEALIGPDTFNTLPPETVAAYRDHGDPWLRLEEHLGVTYALPRQLAALGLDLDAVSGELEQQGVQMFIEPYDKLLASLARRTTELATQENDHA